MKQFTHEELHNFMDNDPKLKERSDKAHALPSESSEDQEVGKLEMMKIYADAVGCKGAKDARAFIREAYALLRQKKELDDLCKKYSSQKLCHSPLGNNYVCFCEE